MQSFISHGVNISYLTVSPHYAVENKDKSQQPPLRKKTVIIWAHGWGQTHESFMPLVTPLSSFAHHIILDLPGFGVSDLPPEDWGTQHYADAIATWIKEQEFSSVIWIGHSFGCRVGVQMAARHPELISNMALISGAGLKRKRPIHKKAYFFCRIRLFKLLRRFIPEGKLKDKLIGIFGSADYQSAGNLRKIFVRVVNEDLSEQAEKIQCPVTLIYGNQDTETPPEFGERYSRLIKHSKLFLLDGQDHYSVLQNGRHQVIKIISDIIKDQTVQ
ncbi:MAG: alpha/beta fold hydrolase [Alphaproteobacteria bacterium]